MKERVALLVATFVLLATLAIPAVFVRQVRWPIQGRGVEFCFRWLPVSVVHVSDDSIHVATKGDEGIGLYVLWYEGELNCWGPLDRTPSKPIRLWGTP